jgi:hypothetical protein
MATVDDRLSALEAEVLRLRTCLLNGGKPQSWLDAVAGSFRNEPEFDEVLRLGREIRANDPQNGTAETQG